jgi:ABC-type uncharacterized transport system permease subunit
MLSQLITTHTIASLSIATIERVQWWVIGAGIASGAAAGLLLFWSPHEETLFGIAAGAAAGFFLHSWYLQIRLARQFHGILLTLFVLSGPAVLFLRVRLMTQLRKARDYEDHDRRVG